MCRGIILWLALPIIFRVISLDLEQSYDCPSAHEETWRIWGNGSHVSIQNRKYSYNKTKHYNNLMGFCKKDVIPQIAKFMGPTWGPPGSCRNQMGPMLAPWILLSASIVNTLESCLSCTNPSNWSCYGTWLVFLCNILWSWAPQSLVCFLFLEYFIPHITGERLLGLKPTSCHKWLNYTKWCYVWTHNICVKGE